MAEGHQFEKVDSKLGQSATNMGTGLGRTSNIVPTSRAAALLKHLQNTWRSVSRLDHFPSSPSPVANHEMPDDGCQPNACEYHECYAL